MRLILTISLALLVCCSSRLNNVPELIKLDGIVIYTFTKKGSVYWLRNILYESKDGKTVAALRPDVSALESISKICQDGSLIEFVDKIDMKDFKKQMLYYSPHYRDQSKRGDNPTHYGGDIFDKTDNSIVIAFGIKGQGVLFEHVCDEYLKEINMEQDNTPPCIYKQNDIQAPLIVLTKYDTTYSLQKTQVSKMNLRKSNLKSFTLVWCE